MKIGIDVSQMCYEGTGVARYVHDLSQALLQVGQGQHEIIFFAGALRQRAFFTRLMAELPWSTATWKIVPFPPKITRIVFGLLPIKIESFTGYLDIFHASDWSQPNTLAPSVTTVHDLVFKKYPDTVDPLIRRSQEQRLKKVVSQGIHLIADSKSTKNDLMEIYHLPSTRIDVVYPGIDSSYSPQSNKEIDRVKRKYKLPDQYLLSVGTQEPRKNLTRLKEAVSGLDLPLVLTGKYGWGDQESLTTPGVISTGYVPDSDLPALYSGASVFVYPSLYEGFGFPVLEAMACGTPVVVSNVSSLPEVAGSAAILIDPLSIESIRQGIKLALASHDKLVKLGLNQAKQFTWEATAQQVLKVYDKTINH